MTLSKRFIGALLMGLMASTAMAGTVELRNESVSGKPIEAAIALREALNPGDHLDGPSLIVEPQTTTLVSADFGAQIDGNGNIWLTRKRKLV